ncbi:hypothetical protein L195_g063887, partial [Trifolium pratense]
LLLQLCQPPQPLQHYCPFPAVPGRRFSSLFSIDHIVVSIRCFAAMTEPNHLIAAAKQPSVVANIHE